ncbi:MAG: DUF1592 domain-containing protein, partial [Planctomycetota bacterium]
MLAKPRHRLLWTLCIVALAAANIFAVDPSQPTTASSGDATLRSLKLSGLERSRYRETSPGEESAAERNAGDHKAGAAVPEANLAEYRSVIQPLLEQHCMDCHGSDDAEGNFRVDTLEPDLLNGSDTEWWAEVFSVVTKGEMPPADASELQDDERQEIVDWLATELQHASMVRRQSEEHSSFRRLTRYEINYALQDLLGVPWDFAKDLPPEAHSEDGFQNSADHLHLSVSQFETFHRIARKALDRVIVTGDQPETRQWMISMSAASKVEWANQKNEIQKAQKELKDEPEKLEAKLAEFEKRFQKAPSGAHFHDRTSGRFVEAKWKYNRARHAIAPDEENITSPTQDSHVAVLPHGQGPRLIFELGNQVPDEGFMRVTVSASQAAQSKNQPSLQLFFGWQASNEGRALIQVSQQDTIITAKPEEPQTVQWLFPLGEIYPRNSVRTTGTMGETPSPSEYIRLLNRSVSPSTAEVNWVRVEAPVYEQWPPQTHQNIFRFANENEDEAARARSVIAAFMKRAWRGAVVESDFDRKLRLFQTIRPQCESFEEAVAEVLATVLASPRFLYVANDHRSNQQQSLDPTRNAKLQGDGVGGPGGPLAGKPGASATSADDASGRLLANRLALFLWCSIPDEKLLSLADDGRLADEDVLVAQVQRMLADPRSHRFAKHFVDQWLDMQLLEFQDFKRHVRGFDPLLKEAMQEEPVAFFSELLRENASVLDFIHCDYAMVNERLAKHYGIKGVVGNQFRRVELNLGFRRGGLLTQAGLLAMNSDYPDSHPLKRAIWLLESVLADPPPPPPPAVPQIDLADP